ncbi:HD-GYP domain-containing protein [Paenibacillus agricola]|uniref:HD-GYP domain-containing protein n=1 Tax=Paenibacillus agricola TaxID=2716264 RepID=A0ABX0J919_9BACL|nr:HD-GYP domain-containing protein [Paenibacillus agricola]NHN31816.1 HD-GYP domain-containing protein [Paenibacillus agricola]
MGITKAYIGKRIMKDVMNATGVLVLSANTVLTKSHIENLNKHRIESFDLDVVIDPISKIVEEQVRYISDMFGEIRISNQIPILEIKSKLIPKLLPLINQTDFFRTMQNIKVTDDEYLYKHSLGVGIMAATIGKWLQLGDGAVLQLLVSGLLHDVGKMKVPSSILDKPGPLDDYEREVLKKHPIWGYEVIKDTVGISNRISTAVLQHHEREDGSGYPYGLQGDQIDLYSKIISVADIFHALLSDRLHQPSVPSMVVVQHFSQQIYGKLPSPILLTFFKRFFQHLLGKQVLLSDGSIGKVIYLNPYEFLRPLVQQEQAYIDLSKRRDVSLLEVI